MGGLVAAAGLCLDAFARQSGVEQQRLAISPRIFIAVGLLIAMTSGILGMISHAPYLAGVWWVLNVPVIGPLDFGTPLVFDIGVYLLVCGVALLLILTLIKENP